MLCSSRAFSLVNGVSPMTHRRVYSSIEWERLQRRQVHRRITPKSTRSMCSLSLTRTISANVLPPLISYFSIGMW